MGWKYWRIWCTKCANRTCSSSALQYCCIFALLFNIAVCKHTAILQCIAATSEREGQTAVRAWEGNDATIGMDHDGLDATLLRLTYYFCVWSLETWHGIQMVVFVRRWSSRSPHRRWWWWSLTCDTVWHITCHMLVHVRNGRALTYAAPRRRSSCNSHPYIVACLYISENNVCLCIWLFFFCDSQQTTLDCSFNCIS